MANVTDAMIDMTLNDL